jgi:Pilus formation protein N terminal region
MAAVCVRKRARSGPWFWLRAALTLVALVAPAAAGPGADDTIVIFLDQARLLQLPDRAAEVVIGNPLIADLTIQPHGLAVVTGKGYGATNFIVTDKKGAVLMEKIVEVTLPNERIVVVYRGVERETYSCTPDCSRRLTLGDNADYFDKSLGQIVNRNSQAAGAAATNAGR